MVAKDLGFVLPTKPMLIVAIDTSWKHGSIALARGDADRFELLETAPLTGGAFSAQLVPQVAAVLARRKLTKQALDAFAAVSGPGSFTGLRVGLAAIKGLAEVLKKPIAVASVLEALALVSGVNGRVLTALDAQRGEIFLGAYNVDVETLLATSLENESLLTREAFVSALPAGSTLITPDASIAELAPKGVAVRTVDRPGAEVIARIGVRKILCGHTVTVDALDANYIRRSDAEIFSAPK